jgi:hypothetical protein
LRGHAARLGLCRGGDKAAAGVPERNRPVGLERPRKPLVKHGD